MSRASLRQADITSRDGLPVTRPARTLVDLATELGATALERAVNEADKYDLIDPETLRLVLDNFAGEPGVRPLRALNGYEVDFFWPDMGLVVETDGLHYHRTASEQTRDHRRDQAHAASGLTTLRFTHWQVKHEQAHVRRILGRTIERLRSA